MSLVSRMTVVVLLGVPTVLPRDSHVEYQTLSDLRTAELAVKLSAVNADYP
jgi:hypothetical protein